jgi:hypothetical protein
MALRSELCARLDEDAARMKELMEGLSAQRVSYDMLMVGVINRDGDVVMFGCTVGRGCHMTGSWWCS